MSRIFQWRIILPQDYIESILNNQSYYAEKFLELAKQINDVNEEYPNCIGFLCGVTNKKKCVGELCVQCSNRYLLDSFSKSDIRKLRNSFMNCIKNYMVMEESTQNTGMGSGHNYAVDLLPKKPNKKIKVAKDEI